MNEKIFQLISEVAKKSVTELNNLSDQQGLWDSLLHVELVVALESEFDIFFSPEEQFTMTVVVVVSQLDRISVDPVGPGICAAVFLLRRRSTADICP